MSYGRQVCLVVGAPKGFTRFVVEGLLKRGSKVIFTSRDPAVGEREQRRLGQLFGDSRVHCAHADHTSEKALESVLVKALDTFGGVNFVVNSTANDRLRLPKEELAGTADVRQLDRKIDRLILENDVRGMKRLARLAVKYMGRHNGFAGGSVLNIASGVELSGKGEAGQCTGLGTTRGLGLSRHYSQHGVKIVTVYQPTIDYPGPSDQSARSVLLRKYSDYTREYSGYMSLHVADTAASGTVWAFSPAFKLYQVLPEQMSTCCGIANKMCFWLGCPMCDDLTVSCEPVERPQSSPARNETQEASDR